MSNTITIRKSPDDEKWLAVQSRKTKQSPGVIIKSLIQQAREEKPDNSRLLAKYSGVISGLPKNRSAKKGFSR